MVFVQLHKPPAWDDVELYAGEEPYGAVTPGDREEELRVRVGRTLNDGAVHENQLITEKKSFIKLTRTRICSKENKTEGETGFQQIGSFKLN